MTLETRNCIFGGGNCVVGELTASQIEGLNVQFRSLLYARIRIRSKGLQLSN